MRWPGADFTLSRRVFFPFFSGVCLAQTTGRGRTFPSSAVRYADPATEAVILRLTDPQYTSLLPGEGNRTVTNRGLLYASDMSGSMQAFWMDLKSKESRQLSEAVALDSSSLSFSANEKNIRYFDGPQLLEAQFPNVKKTREIYRLPDNSTKLPGINYAADDPSAVFVEQTRGMYRLRVLDLTRGTAATLLEGSQVITALRIRPGRSQLVYRQQGEKVACGVISFDGRERHDLAREDGDILDAQWTADGASLLYLLRPRAPGLTQLRQWNPDSKSGGDSLIAITSQFVRFTANTDSSIFIGVSGSKASPYLLLLTRSGKRELSLAELRTSMPSQAGPLLAPNSQFAVFPSDRHGKPAIYWIPLDKLVAETAEPAKS